MEIPKLSFKTMMAAIVLIGMIASQTAEATEHLTIVQTFPLEGRMAIDSSLINVNSSYVIGANNMVLGTQLTFDDMKYFPDDNVGQTLMRNTGLKLVRVFDDDFEVMANKGQIPPIVVSWNETSHSGTYNWTVVDRVIQSIYSSGAEPMIVLMSKMALNANAAERIFKNGFDPNSATYNLPNVFDAESYARAWAAHMKEKGFPIKYWEIGNEIETWLFTDMGNSWQFFFSTEESTKAGCFATIYNRTVTAIKQVYPSASVSFDFVWFRGMIDWWVSNYNGTPIDRIDFHRYESHVIGNPNDSALFGTAQSMDEGDFTFWSGSNPILAQQKYYSGEGVRLPIYDTECNMGSVSGVSDEPRIVQMSGAVYTALVLKTEILKGVSYHVYYDWQANLPWEQTRNPPTYGFGLINDANHQPW
jgi:hypothetical protein